MFFARVGFARRFGLSFLMIGAPLVAQQYVISTVAGGAPPPAPAAALTASIATPTGSTQGIAPDSVGNVYFHCCPAKVF